MFVYELPLLISGLAIVAILAIYSVIGLWFVRRYLLPRMRIHEQDAEFSSGMVQAVMVFYGLAVALIAVNVYQAYSSVTQIVSQEATTIAMLYRDVSGYPEPIRPQLQKELRDYTDQVIHEAWPLQQKGQVPSGGVMRMTRFQSILLAFEPATEGQKILHAETLGAYNRMTQARRMRLDAVDTHLPHILWFVIVVGALISLSSSFFFKLEDARVQGVQVVLLAIFIGLVIFMILALDHPFVGDLGIKPDAYQLVYDHLMKP